MRKMTITPEKRCPRCKKVENQVKKGFNKSGSQRCYCKDCEFFYTIDPKKHEYSEKERKQALKVYFSGVSGRGVGNIFKFSKTNVYNWIKKNEKS